MYVTAAAPDATASAATPPDELIMQILTGPILYLTWCSVRQRQPSYPEQWQNVPNSYLIVFIPQ